MASVQVLSPFEIFTDVDGNPLEDGFVYIGQAGLDPLANPVSTFFDAALTIPAVQPIRTKGGYASNAGAPSRIFVAQTAYSTLVRNKNNFQILLSLTSPATSIIGPASSTDNELPLFNGTSGNSLKGSGTIVTAAGLALLDDATAAAQRTTLGLGTAAVANVTTTTTDTTAGRVVKVGDYGWNGGTAVAQTNAVSADTLNIATLYSFPNGGLSLPNNAQAWYVRVSVHGALIWQEARGMTVANQDAHYSRVWTGAAWSTWILVANAGANSTITSLSGLTTPLSVTQGGTGGNTQGTAQTGLGLVIGTDVQAFDSDLAALAANATNGLWARTGAGTGAARAITGTASQITVTNGDGVAGAPILSFPASMSFAGKTITDGGSVTTIDINGGTVDGTVIGGAAAAAGTFTTTSQTTATVSTSINLTGGQIAFPAAQIPSAGANVLDDYEEGTFTPNISFATPGDLTVVYSTQAGFYTKVGRLLQWSVQLITTTFTHTTASGQLLIINLPFASAQSTQVTMTRWAGITSATATPQVGGLATSSGQVQWEQMNVGAGTSASMTTANAPTGVQKSIFMGGTYHV